MRLSPAEAHALHDDLLISVTSFFRDPAAFEALATIAFPRLLKAARSDAPVRVWVLGCSTGEEAYSLAIALTEFSTAAGIKTPIQIFASDVNHSGIAVARQGVYPRQIAQDVSSARLERFFVADDEHYRVVKSVRELCVFSRHNVLTDPPFARINLVSCRNLLIYMQPVLQQDVIRNLHYALTPGGVLWLGRADGIGSDQALSRHLRGTAQDFRTTRSCVTLTRRSPTSSLPACCFCARSSDRSSGSYRNGCDSIPTGSRSS